MRFLYHNLLAVVFMIFVHLSEFNLKVIQYESYSLDRWRKSMDFRLFPKRYLEKNLSFDHFFMIWGHEFYCKTHQSRGSSAVEQIKEG